MKLDRITATLREKNGGFIAAQYTHAKGEVALKCALSYLIDQQAFSNPYRAYPSFLAVGRKPKEWTAWLNAGKVYVNASGGFAELCENLQWLGMACGHGYTVEITEGNAWEPSAYDAKLAELAAMHDGKGVRADQIWPSRLGLTRLCELAQAIPMAFPDGLVYDISLSGEATLLGNYLCREYEKSQWVNTFGKQQPA